MTDTTPYMAIKDVRPSQKNINVMFIILEIGKVLFYIYLTVYVHLCH